MINLSRIDARLRPPGDIYADTPARLALQLENGKSFIASYSLTIEFGGEKTYLPKLPAHTKVIVPLGHVFNKRGWNSIPEARLSTRFPFSFFRKWIKLDLGEEKLLVYPKVYDVSASEHGRYLKPGESQAERTGNGYDMKSLREYTDGDNPRLIHWKTSARRGSLMIREMHDEESRAALIEFIPDKDAYALEIQIGRLASLIMALLRVGYDVEFVSPDRKYITAQSGNTPGHVLTYLALFDNLQSS